MKYVLLLLLLSLSGCFLMDRSVHPKVHTISPTIPPGCILKGGVEDPDMNKPPYAYVQIPGDPLWYPAGQCKSDEELGQHGH